MLFRSHSTSLYLLVSKDRFVKHEEFLIPNILLILPLLIRAILYIIFSDEQNNDDDGSSDESDETKRSNGTTDTVSTSSSTTDDENRNGVNLTRTSSTVITCNIVTKQSLREFSFTAIGQSLLISFVWTTLACYLICYLIPLLPDDGDTKNMSVIEYIPYQYPMELLYGLFVLILAKVSHMKTSGSSSSSSSSSSLLSCPLDRKYQRCIQFVSCLLATYIHIGIAFGHVSLAYPSALIWTPLLAFPTYNHRHEDMDKKVGTISFFSAIGIFLITSSFTFLVPNIFPTYTPYVRYVYIPLHMMFCIQHIIPVIHNGHWVFPEIKTKQSPSFSMTDS